jgi:hypothetical protein
MDGVRYFTKNGPSTLLMMIHFICLKTIKRIKRFIVCSLKVVQAVMHPDFHYSCPHRSGRGTVPRRPKSYRECESRADEAPTRLDALQKLLPVRRSNL